MHGLRVERKKKHRRPQLVLEPLEGRTLPSLTGFFTPDDLRDAYEINQIKFGGSSPIVGDGAGQTIAVLAGGIDSQITSDLQSFDRNLFPSSTVNLDTFGSYNGPSGLPSGSTQPWFNIISQTGANAPSTASQSTSGEISLDVEWSHAMAPMANILLVQFGNNTTFDIGSAAAFAASQPGVSVVTDSYYAGSETSSEDADFVAPAGHAPVTFLAATGDIGALAVQTVNGTQTLLYTGSPTANSSNTAEFPSTSPNVIAVGGTNLTLNNDGSYQSETGWGFPAPVSTVSSASAALVSPSGSWVSTSGGYSGTYEVHSGPSAGAKATWSAQITASEVGGYGVGSVEVSASWTPPASGGATNATYTIYNATTDPGLTSPLASFEVDQSQASSGVPSGNGSFQDLGSFSVSTGSSRGSDKFLVGDTIKVVLDATSANGSVVADAIGLAPDGAGTGGVSASESQTITAATETGNTVTITTGSSHSYFVGDMVTIFGVPVGGYNGTFQVASVPNSTSFTYTDPNGNLAASAGGTASRSLPDVAFDASSSVQVFDSYNPAGNGATITNATENGNTVTITTSTAHNLYFNASNPDFVTISGVGIAQYNGTFKVASTPSSTSFTYVDSNAGLGNSSGGIAAGDVGGFTGTSLSAPCWAGLIAIADQGLAISGSTVLSSATALAKLYSLPSSDFNDVLTGYNGYQAGPGFDLVTGLGSPKANILIPDLAGTSINYTVPAAGGPHQLVLRKNGINVELLDNGTVVDSVLLSTISFVDITDPNSTNDSLTVDYAFDGIFAVPVTFNHTTTAGYDTLEIKAPSGPSNNTVVTENAGGAGSVTVDGAQQTIDFKTISEVDVVDGPSGDAVTLDGAGGSSGLQQVFVTGGAGNDNLTVDSSNGLAAFPGGIHFDGGAGLNTLTLTQSGGDEQTSDVYSVGPNVGQGTDVITGPSGTQTVDFQNLAPVLDNVPATTVTVNGTPAANAINYSQGPGGGIFGTDTTGLVTVDNQESYEFSQKTNLVINGEAGGDTIDLDDATTPTALTGDITINGNDPSGTGTVSDTLIANGTSSVDTIDFSPTGPDAGSITGAGPVSIDFLTIEQVQIDGQGNTDALTVTTPGTANAIVFTPGATANAGSVAIRQASGARNLLVPMSYTNIGAGGSLTFAHAGGGRTDTLTINGQGAGDNFVVTGAAPDHVVLEDANSVLQALSALDTPGVSTLDLVAAGASTTFHVTGPLPYSGGVIVDGGSGNDPAVLDLSAATGAVAVNLADTTVPTNTTLTGYGATVTLIGIDAANLDAASNAVSVVGTSQNDDIAYTPTGTAAGTFQNNGAATVFHVTGVTGDLMVSGGSGGNADELTLQGSDARDLFEINQGTRIGQVLADNVNALLPVQLADSIAILSAVGLGGPNTFQVIPGAGLGSSVDNLVVDLDGGTSGASNALVVGSSFGDSPGTLPATSFVVINKLPTANSGAVRVFQSGVANPDINYKNIQVLAPNVSNTVNGQGLAPNLLIMGPDNYEPNFTQATAAFLGAGAALQIQNASIFPNSAEFPGVPADQDWFRVVAQTTGTIDFQVYFSTFNTALLPGGGVLNIEVRDENGNIVGSSTGTFGAADTTIGSLADGARVRIPAVAGQSYFLHVFGANGTVVNGYNATILNTAPPVPFALELSRSVAAGVAGSPGTGDLPANSPADDSGESQFDNLTNINVPRIYLRLSDGVLLNDLPGNGTTDNPPIGVIPIPFQGLGSATTPGYRVALFDGNNSQTPIGFATQTDPVNFPGLYEVDLVTPLADGVHNLTAAVEMVDPANPTETGFGPVSATPLVLTIDTAPPPVVFGTTANGNDGLAAGSDSGVADNPATATDRVTSVTTPTFFGTAEAGAIIRVYAGGVLLGQTTATPAGGTNAYPNGQWSLTSTISLNDPSFFPFDGTRVISVTAEDAAGNVSAPLTMDIFIDTQGPQISNVQITGSPNFNLFGLKPSNAAQGPTPLVYSLTISVLDNPDRDTANFPNYVALDQGTASSPGNYLVQGDNSGIIPVTQVIVTNNPPVNGLPATATLQLVFAQALPDDRYTITVSDNLTDPAGNKLDGESNASEPLGVPTFPSGDGTPGGSFVARFTVNSRPHIGAVFDSTADLDLNGNGVFDPVNIDSDATNDDATFKFGLNTDAMFAGNFVAQGQTANGFDKLGAYGFVNGAYRWLLDFTGAGVPTFSAVSGVQVDGLPVAYHFNPGLSGDQIALFDGQGNWYIDYGGSNDLGAGTIVVHDGLTGYPIVGDFDGSGHFELATYRPDQKMFYFDLNPLSSSHNIQTLQFGFPGVTARPVAADMNQDGVTDIGLFVPGQDGTASGDPANWYFLVSTGTPVPGTLNTLNHTFSPTPLGHDLQYQFGVNQDLPVVGLFDPPVVASAPPATTLSFISSVYEDVLNRTPSAAELAQWSPAIAQGMTDNQAVVAIATSGEAKTQTISQYYQQYLQRPVDAGGLTGWLSVLNTGGQQTDVLAGILSSPEYYSDHGGTVTGFIEGVYQDLLGRSAAPSEVSTWSALAAAAPATFIRDMLDTIEYQSRLVNSWYQALLGRTADSGGLATWVGALQAGVSQQQVMIDIMSSDEYETIGRLHSRSQAAPTTPAAPPAHTSPPATLPFISSLYQNVFGRTPSNAELTLWGPALGQGLTCNQAVQDILNAPEAQTYLVEEDYEQYLGRTPDAPGLAAWENALAAGATQEEVLTGLLSSPEYINDHGGTVAGFIQGLYQNLLHRAALPAEVNQLSQLSSAAAVVQQVLGSEEYQSDLVSQWYQQLLGRTPDEAGLAAWVASLQNGVTQQQVFAALLSSYEYGSKHGA